MPRRREDVNRKLSKIFSYKSSRSGAQSTLTTSGKAIDNSGLGDGYSIGNLRALSRAVAEACEHLDTVLEDIDGDIDETEDSMSFHYLAALSQE